MKFILLIAVSATKATKYRPPAGSNPWHDEPIEVKPEFKHDYVVPNFGVDSDI